MSATAEHLPRPPVPIRWLHHIYERVEDGWITVFSQDRVTGDRHTDWAHVTDIDALAECVEQRALTSCVWFGVATRREQLNGNRRGGITDCLEIPALWVDIDIAGPNHAADRLPTTIDEAREVLNRYPIPPTVVINTGGGIQPWWLLTDPIAADPDGAELLQRWGATWAHHAGQAGYHLDNVFNVDRVMRLPGTWNRKHEPVFVDAIEADWGRRYTADDLDGYTIEVPVTAPPPTVARLPYIGPKRPGDAFNATRSGNDILAAAGFTHAQTDRNGDQHWCRPGKTPREGHGATIYAADGHTTIWSDTVTQRWPAAATRRPYDPFGLYTVLFHQGDFTAASDELEGHGYGTKAIARDDLSWAVIATKGHAAATTSERIADYLPDELWQARPVLDHIRQAARARLVAPDAVLGAVLARVAAITPHPVEIPGIVGSAMGLTYYTGIVGPPAAGKSAALAVAAELLPAPANIPDRLPIGSGEGFVETLFDLVTEDDGKKKVKVKRQVRFAAIFHIDEGSALTEVGGRQGTTILSTLRTAYTHGTLGATNASTERKRILDGRAYVYGVTLGIQPELAGPLLADTAAGTPQRFVWLMATDPDARRGIAWPGDLPWSPPDVSTLEELAIKRGGYKRYPLHVIDTIRDEIITERIAIQRGDKTVPASEAHDPLVRLKTAALLALLDQRLVVDDTDWHLAGVITTTSRTIRVAVQNTLEVVERAKEEAFVKKHARREIAVEESKETRALASATKSVANVVAKHHEHGDHVMPDGCTERCLSRAIASSHRRVVAPDEVIAEAERRGFITRREGRFHPGDARPA